MSSHFDPMRHAGRGYTGIMLERDAFGDLNDPDLQRNKAFANAHKLLTRQSGYLSYDEAKRLIQTAYPLDPIKPQMPFANDLRIAVADELGLSRKEDLARLGFYTSIGTKFDVLHGVDGFMVYRDKDGRDITVTLDVTTNESKDKAKADVLIRNPLVDPEENERRYLEIIEFYAKEIAQKLKERMGEARNCA